MQQITELTGEALYNRELKSGTPNGSYEKGTYMVTYTGKHIFPLDPNPDDIDIKDIAHALSNNCRFGGHVRQFYSVAQHCVIVSQLCEPENALGGLLHDASEAYLSDIIRPVKYTERMKGYLEIERQLEKVIAKRFSIPFPMTEDIKYADDMALIAEGYALFKPIPDWVFRRLQGSGLSEPLYQLETCWTPLVAKGMFLKRFMELKGVKISVPTQEEIDAATKEN